MRTPEKTNNFNVFKDGDKLLGLASVQLPAFEAMNESYKAAGMMGETNIPILGQFGALTCTMQFHKLMHTLGDFVVGYPYVLDLRIASQALDSGEVKRIIVPERWSLKLVISKVDPGKLETATGSDGSLEGFVERAQHWVDGTELLEFDRYNNIYKVNGEDVYAPVRSAIGE